MIQKTVIVGLSGGVDSSVSALLLKEQGFDVQGLFMKNWEEDDTASYCAAAEDLKDVRAICKKIDIPLHTVNFSQEYWEKVFSLFLEEYNQGRTPNPDILCNKEIKFKAFLEYAMSLGADFIATGHYVQKKGSQLLKGADPNKDQSYFLYTLGQAQIEKSLFPVGHIEKSVVRELAKAADLINHNKKDSTGICFIGERKFNAFLQEYVLSKKGRMQTPEGEIIGEHNGLMFYTLGQRHGLKIGGRKGGLEKPWYVVGKDIKNNILFVSQDENHPWHFSSTLSTNDFHWISTRPENNFECHAKVRYRQADQQCKINIISETEIKVEFSEPQRAVTPGQSVVLYDGNVCLGGGIIQTTNSVGGLIRHCELLAKQSSLDCFVEDSSQ